MVEKITILQTKATELQARWDSHSCQPTVASSGTSSPSKQLAVARAKNEVLEKQAFTARQMITSLENSLAENTKRIEELQREIEQEKKTMADQQKTIADIKSHAKGNLTLLEARSIIWSDIILAVTEQWGFLRMMGENKSAIPYLSRKLQEADLDLSNRAQQAKEYISILNELGSDDMEKHGIPS